MTLKFISTGDGCYKSDHPATPECKELGEEFAKTEDLIDEYYFKKENVSCYLREPSASGWCYTDKV